MSIKKLFYGVVGAITAECIALNQSWYILGMIIPVAAVLSLVGYYIHETSKNEPKKLLR